MNSKIDKCRTVLHFHTFVDCCERSSIKGRIFSLITYLEGSSLSFLSLRVLCISTSCLHSPKRPLLPQNWKTIHMLCGLFEYMYVVLSACTLINERLDAEPASHLSSDHHFLKNIRLIFHSAKKRKNIIYCLAESSQQLSLDLMLTSRMMTQNFLFPGPMVH